MFSREFWEILKKNLFLKNISGGCVWFVKADSMTNKKIVKRHDLIVEVVGHVEGEESGQS